jgi:colanic acid/amylovoran biosynthesis glycosyltransferase
VNRLDDRVRGGAEVSPVDDVGAVRPSSRSLSANTREGSGRSSPVTYVVAEFPLIRTTFVVREMDGLVAAGIPIHLIALLRPETGKRHARMERWLSEVAPRPSTRTCVRDLAWWLRRRPLRSLQIAGSILTTTVFRLHRPRAGIAALLLGASHSRRLRKQPSMHLHAHFPIPSDTVWVMHRLAGFPYSFTVHTEEGIVTPSTPRNAKAARFIATPSRYTEQRLRQRVGLRVPLEVIRAGIPTSEYNFRPRQIPTEGPVRAVCVAGLETYKGHALLLRSLSSEDDVLERITLDLVGDGPIRHDLENLTQRLGLASRVRFHGAMTEDEVRGVLADADLFVLASIFWKGGQYDNIPVALMEAMASGVSVIASRLAGIPELVVDGVTGTLALPGDVDDLRRALRHVLSDSAGVLRMTRAARALVEEEFDLDVNAERLAALLSGVGAA